GIELRADEQERETCCKRRPEPCEMPDRAAPIERHDSRVARRVVMLDRLVESLTLEREVFPQLRYVVRVLLGRMMVEVAWAFRHRQLLLASCAVSACESVTKGWVSGNGDRLDLQHHLRPVEGSHLDDRVRRIGRREPSPPQLDDLREIRSHVGEED